jgi:hypothetical protein
MKPLDQMDDNELQMAMRLEDLKEKGIDNLSDDELYELDQLDIKLEGGSIQGPSGLPQKDYGVGESALQGFGQGITYGHLPQAQALFSQVMPDPEEGVNKALERSGFEIVEPQESYAGVRDKFIQDIQGAQQQNPKAFMGAQIAGGTLPFLNPTFAAQTTAGKIAAGAGSGALASFLQNPSDIEGQISGPQIKERLMQAPIGAALGAGVSAALPLAGKVAAMAAPQSLKDMAYDFAIDAIGAMKKGRNALEVKNNAKRLGKRLLDEGLVEAGDSFSSIASKIDDALNQSRDELNNIYDEADYFFQNVRASGTPQKLIESTKIKPLEIAKIFESKIGLKRGDIGYTNYKNSIDRILFEFADNPSEISLSRARELRQSLDENIKWSKRANELPEVQKTLKEIRNSLNDLIEKRLAVVDKLNGGNRAARFRATNERLTDLLDASKISKDRLKGEGGNRLISLTGNIAGGQVGGMTALKSNNILYGLWAFLGVALSEKILRTRGNAVAASALRNIANLMAKSPELLSDSAKKVIEVAIDNPNEVARYIQKVRLENPRFDREMNSQELGGVR